MSGSEFPRAVDVRQADGRSLTLTADETERQALARRFGIVGIDRLEAEVALDRDGDAVSAQGTLTADIVQACAVSAEDFAVAIREPISFRFVTGTRPAPHGPDGEFELAADDLDEIEFEGTAFDLGEAVAQSLALAIDPFATGPGADEARRRAGLIGEGEAGPFAALKGLKLGK